MRIQSMRKAVTWALGSSLLAGVLYGILTLTLTVQPAYASSCNCAEERSEAEVECFTLGAGLVWFDCLSNEWLALCSNNQEIGEPCSGT
jgi:hypothetical protein